MEKMAGTVRATQNKWERWLLLGVDCVGNLNRMGLWRDIDVGINMSVRAAGQQVDRQSGVIFC